jgi:DNA mismatch repair protein MutS
VARGGDKKKLTPVMQQHAEAKARYPDALVFFRLGDFYELFYDDARLAGRLLHLTVTSRNREDPESEPMAGVPAHAAHGYIAKLLAAGHKVAICEQMADPSKVKGIVPREVVRVITPGLVTSSDQLEARENHFLAAVHGDEAQGSLGLALFDLSTSELFVTDGLDGAGLIAELARASVHEVLLASPAGELGAALRLALPGVPLRADEPLSDARGLLDEALASPLSPEALAAVSPEALAAAARALRYAKASRPRDKLPVERLTRLARGETLALDETAVRHLELVRAQDGGRRGSLLDVLDATVSAPGARLLRRRLLAPLLDPAAIDARLGQVEALVVHARAREELRAALTKVGDLERLTTRAELGEATPRDLGALRDSLAAAPLARHALASLPDPVARAAFELELDLAPGLAARLATVLVAEPPGSTKEGDIVADGVDAELDEQRALRVRATELVAALEARLRAETGVASLRVKYTSVFGWYVEVTKANLTKVPASFRRKQTVAGGERFTTDELDELAERIQHAEERERARQRALFDELVCEVRRNLVTLRVLGASLASWDVAAALAEVAHQHDYTRPRVDAGAVLELEGARHAVVERLAAAGRFVPNDVRLDRAGERLWLVTGPNMAGKSTLMRQVAQAVILAQMGSFVPAKRAHVGVVDRVLSRVGASDDLSRGESTFMVEMRETARILRDATPRSLVVLDEIGRGTSTFDGLSIAWAVAEHLHDVVGCRALFATHYHELTALASERPHVANVSVAAREHDGDVVFLHRLVRGPASRSYGIAVARLAGLPSRVTTRAAALLAQLEGEAERGSDDDAGHGGGELVGRSRRRAGAVAPQLSLFAAASPAAGPARRRSARDEALAALCAALRALDIGRTTPLEALNELERLRRMALDVGDD